VIINSDSIYISVCFQYSIYTSIYQSHILKHHRIRRHDMLQRLLLNNLLIRLNKTYTLLNPFTLIIQKTATHRLLHPPAHPLKHPPHPHKPKHQPQNIQPDHIDAVLDEFEDDDEGRRVEDFFNLEGQAEDVGEGVLEAPAVLADDEEGDEDGHGGLVVYDWELVADYEHCEA
jgi:hypothetical protein